MKKFEGMVIRCYIINNHFHDNEVLPVFNGRTYHNFDAVFAAIGAYDSEHFLENGGKIKWMDTDKDFDPWDD